MPASPAVAIASERSGLSMPKPPPGRNGGRSITPWCSATRAGRCGDSWRRRPLPNASNSWRARRPADGPRRTLCIGIARSKECYQYIGGPTVECDRGSIVRANDSRSVKMRSLQAIEKTDQVLDFVGCLFVTDGEHKSPLGKLRLIQEIKKRGFGKVFLLHVSNSFQMNIDVFQIARVYRFWDILPLP